MKVYKNKILLILYFIALFLFIFISATLIKFSDIDMIWCFHNTLKMYNGGLIYSCNNVIDTPIFFYIGKIFFKCFGANLFIFNIYATLIFFTKYLLIYCIFRKLKIDKTFSCLFIMPLLILFLHNFGANYNELVLVFALLGILTFIFFDKSKYYNFLQGFIIFLTFFTKQTTGIYYVLGILLYESLTSKSIKTFFKNQFLKLCTFLPCLLFFIVLMYFQGNLFNFIDLCFGSLLEFGKNNYSLPPTNSLPILIAIIIFIIFPIITLVFSKNLNKDVNQNIIFLFCISIGMTLNAFPIINYYHLTMVCLFYYLLFAYSIYITFLKDFFDTEKMLIFIRTICCLIFIALYIYSGYQYFKVKNLKKFDSSSIFYNAYVEDEDLERINTICSFIKNENESGINILVLESTAAEYMVNLQKSNNEFDMLLYGNLGFNGVQKTIDKMSKMKNTKFLIFTDEEDCFYQTPTEIRNYVIDNFTKTGEILDYSIYSTD